MKAEIITLWSSRPFSDRDFWLRPSELPAEGSHVFAVRSGYSHHGIYVGDGKVVHYAGLARRWTSGPVEEVSLEQFADGRAVFVRLHVRPRFALTEVAERARTRIGEASYRLFTNNCEHFCEWCIHGTSRSEQVETLVRAPRRMLRILCAAVSSRLDQWLPPPAPPPGGCAA